NYEAYTQASNFFGRLYATGDICRIFADEHTGLLSRKKRETVERRFKTKKGDQKSWHINLLSCTPTLELGIDIGDLSSIILCSMPPTQAQFLQRVGRPGRKDGNAFSAVVANLKPHDMYFYEQPYEMIAGDVKAPTIFLNASAVLERQFFAFCFDCWIKESAGRKNMVPKDISKCLTSIEKPERKIFPFNFLEYVEYHLQPLYQAFCELFDDKTLDEDSKEKLHQFAFGDAQTEGSLGYKVVKAFKAIKDERDAVRFQLKSLTKVINAVEREPDDQKKTEKLESLYREKGALSRLVVEISSKNVYNFLSDEGLLPNYAFPEAGVSLKAIIYRKLEKNPSNKKKYEHYVYEYMRPAASAIVEFAPDNAFYSGGRKLVIDQIDVKSSEPELWRLCPNCSHAQRVVEKEDTRTCPRCGDAGWVDSGQVKRMLRMKQVYATDEYTGSFSGDETDDRSNKFYTKDLYVDVDPQNIVSAWKIDDPDNAFGFEYVKKATLRDINFGEKTTLGQPFFVAGEEKIRSGFKICKECGKIQKNSNKSRKNHYFSCSYADSNDKSEYEEEVYLYREFESEALRILIPTTSIQLNEVVENSFIAAVMLGLKEYFGSVDHLRATVSRVPVAGAEYERIYLTVYDTVPGGTGYLKHLLKNPHHVFDMLQKAVDVMADCECQSNPKHDGCYRCLFAYKLSRYANTISKSVALDLLRGIVADREKLTSIKSLVDIPLTRLFDSELEKMFIEGLRQYASKYEIVIKPGFHHSREGFFFKVGDNEYFISEQVLLSPSEGVNVRTRADFLIERLDGNQAFKPIAVYTDGFSFHRDSVADDFLKR
ncbi:MAG TPA: DUF1998 domain-containing protein, partial [Thermotogota bacterium]|nr:DUF1998 domain-containing protein [Thermotogota bacterium]